jgi:hypothetical protein
LSSDQLILLREIGTFRTVLVSDIERHHYDSRHGQLRQDVAVLTREGLAEKRTHAPKPGTAYTVLVLTKQGKNLLEREECNHGRKQKFYANFVKPSEIRHDVGIYRMYQLEKARIEREGGTVKRIVLDFELKQRVFEKLNKYQAEPPSEYAERKREIAEESGIAVVNGRLVFPDVRIEYETLDHEPAKVDLELASGDYKESQIAAKHRAGLRIYGPDSGLGSPALSDPEIVVAYISL